MVSIHKRAVLKVAAYIESVLQDTPFSIQSVDVGTTEGGFSVSLFLNITQEELHAALDVGIPLSLSPAPTNTSHTSAVQQIVTEIQEKSGVSFQSVSEDGALLFESGASHLDQLNLELDDQPVTNLASVPSLPVEVQTPTIVLSHRRASKADDVLDALKKRQPKEVVAEKIVGAGPSFLTKEALSKFEAMYIDDGETNG